MTTLYTTTFTGSNGAIPNWTDLVNAWQINTNAAKPTTGAAFNVSYYTGVAFPNDQWAQAVFTGIGSGINRAPSACIRVGATGGYYFGSQYGGAGWDLGKFNSVGSNTSLASGSVTIASGNTFYLQAVGTALIAKFNGSQVASITDSVFAAGSPGLFTYSDDAAETSTAFSAGNFIVPASLLLLGAG